MGLSAAVVRDLQAVQWTFRLFEGESGDGLEIDHGGFDVGMAEQALDGLEVVIGQKEMRGVRVAKSMRGNPFEDSSSMSSGFDCTLDM